MSVDTSAVDPFGGLEGEDRDAYSAMLGVLREYGLESLAPTLFEFIQQGYSADTINVLLPNTAEYKQRFAANEARKQKGLPVLSPAEYLATERSYRQVMAAGGLPVGFYDEPGDFEQWLANDVSPVEVQERVGVAQAWVNSLDPDELAKVSQWYTTGDLVAYALDPDRTVAVLDRQFRAGRVGGAAQAQGVEIDRLTGERIAETGVSTEQAREGFGTVVSVTQNAGRLSKIYGGTYDESDAIGEVFFADREAGRKRRRLASQERAQFAGSSGANATSLSKRSGGQV